MPIVEPFRALTFAPALRGELDRLVAPPYDVITESERQRLASHPGNIVHLDLPRAEGGADPYAWASGQLRRFVADRILVREDRRAFYILDQRFTDPAGGERVRRGFFARLRLEPFEAGVVIPHERTLERPREDRQRLLAATRTHLSAVFLLHPDPGGEVARILERASTGRPGAQARDRDGTVSRMVSLDDPAVLASITDRLAPAWALIADGHHRYESALAYRDARRSEGSADAEHVLVFLCSLADPGLTIFPIHRLVRGLPSFDPGSFCERLAAFFSLTPFDSGPALQSALRGKAGRPGSFGMVLAGEERHFLLEWRDGAGFDRAEMAAIPPPLRRLDVILLHRLVLEASLGITIEAQAQQSHLDYVKDDEELFRRVRQGLAQIGFALNPTRMEQVIEVSRSGLRLPQKSTYFYPKVPTGFVLDPLDPA
ncbi:MAG TPA: DUF1015 domain-containing protein [Candidatus Polarisedimenticolia bacterium]